MGNENSNEAKSVFDKDSTLNKLNLKDVPRFTLEDKIFNCRVYLGDLEDIEEKNTKSDVYDGDSLHVVIVYNDIPHKFYIRMLGIDCPELRPRWIKNGKKMSTEEHEAEKKEAIKSRNFLKNFIKGKNLRIRFGKHGKFGGRFLGELFTVDYNGNLISVNKWMIKSGFAKIYNGGKR